MSFSRQAISVTTLFQPFKSLCKRSLHILHTKNQIRKMWWPYRSCIYSNSCLTQVQKTRISKSFSLDSKHFNIRAALWWAVCTFWLCGYQILDANQPLIRSSKFKILPTYGFQSHEIDFVTGLSVRPSVVCSNVDCWEMAIGRAEIVSESERPFTWRYK
mgnify:CR=1 FL=1